MSTDRNSEFTHFNLVIRLSKVQQLALRLCTILRCPAAPVVPWDPCEILFYWVKLCRTFRNLLFCSNFTATSGNTTWNWIRQAHVFQVWSFSFWWLSVVWWGETCCAPNSLDFESCYMPIGARLDHGPGAGNNRTTFRKLGTESCFWFCFSLTSSPLVPYLMLSSLPR